MRRDVISYSWTLSVAVRAELLLALSAVDDCRFDLSFAHGAPRAHIGKKN